MSTKNRSVGSRLNPFNYKFGTKLNLLIFVIIFTSLIISDIAGIRFSKAHIRKLNLNKVAEVSSLKKNILENDYKQFIQTLYKTDFDSWAYDISDLVLAFRDYKNDRMSAFEADSITYYRNQLSQFYQDELISRINFEKPGLDMVLPASDQQVVLQISYIVQNPGTWKEKSKMDKAGDYSLYSGSHASVHNQMRNIAQRIGLNDIYLIDAKRGDIFYSLNKNIAFGGNVLTSYLSQTELASVYQRAMVARRGEIICSDFARFIPGFNLPVAFYAIPVFDNGKRIAVAVAEITPEFFNPFLNSDLKSSDKNKVSHLLVGKDRFIRSIPAEEYLDKNTFLAITEDAEISEENIKNTVSQQTGVLNLQFPDEYNIEATRSFTAKNYLGQNAFLSSVPLNFAGQNWYLVSQIDSEQTSNFLGQYRLLMIMIFTGLMLIAYLVTYLFQKSYVRRINVLQAAMQKLSNGEEQEKPDTNWRDELGETIDKFTQLSGRIDEAGNFAIALSEERFEQEFKAISEKDRFAKALNTLRTALLKNKKEYDERQIEDKIRNWSAEGIARFNDLLRQSNNNIQNLAYLIIENLISYVNANIGGIYLVEGETEETRKIRLIAAYAYDRRKFNTRTIEIGEGLIGNCYLEKKPVYLKKLPQDYMEIGTGLGSTSPNSLYIAPLLYDDEVLGFVEIASIEEFKSFEIEFINKLSENIAATFSTVRLNSKTAELLEESKRRANEIAQQEEEMRQNMEEMQATQEELSRLRTEDEQRTRKLQAEIDGSKAMLQQIINSMEGEVYIKDSSGIIVLANEEAATRFATIPEKLLGKSDNHLFAHDRLEKESSWDKACIENGIVSDEITELVGSHEQKYFVIKKPFYLPATSENGIITMRMKR